jgi:hypothetical protein
LKAAKGDDDGLRCSNYDPSRSTPSRITGRIHKPHQKGVRLGESTRAGWTGVQAIAWRSGRPHRMSQVGLLVFQGFHSVGRGGIEVLLCPKAGRVPRSASKKGSPRCKAVEVVRPKERCRINGRSCVCGAAVYAPSRLPADGA